MKSTMVFQITEEAIRCVHVSDSTRRVLSADGFSTGAIEEANLGQALKDFVQTRKLKFADARVIIVLPRGRTILRLMNLPSHNDGELRSMADLQAAAHLPYAREDVEMDFQILHKSPNGYSQVMAVIAPKDMVLKWWEIFMAAHIPIDAMTISSVGLWLLGARQRSLKEGLAAIIDVNTDHSEVCFFYKNYWVNSREIPLGVRQMQQDCAEFIRQWDLTWGTLVNEKIGEMFNAVFLAGQAPQIPSLKEELSLKVGFDPTEVECDQELVPCAAAMGVALEPDLPPVNLVPEEVLRSQAQKVYHRELNTFYAWVGAGLLMIALALSAGIIDKNIQLRVLKGKLAAAKKDSAAIEEQLHRVQEVSVLLKSRLIFTDWIAAIGRILPPKVALVNVTLSNDNILSIQGTSPNTGDISKLQEGMIRSPLFSRLTLDYVNKRTTVEGEINYFKMTCLIKPEEADDEKLK